MIATSSKLCSACGQLLPVDRFGPRAGVPDGRRGWCRVCTAAYARAWRAARRARALDRFTSECRKARTLRKVGALVAGATARFGGLDAMATAFVDHLRAAKPGSRRAIIGLVALLNAATLAAAAQQRQPAAEAAEAGPPNLRHLTDEQLERELRAWLNRRPLATT